MRTVCMGLRVEISSSLTVVITALSAWVLLILLLSQAAAETIYSNASAVVNDEINLPCNIDLPFYDDKIILILWYKQGSVSPIYSLDLRSKPIDVIPSFPPDDARSRFKFHVHGDKAHLQIQKVKEEDEGVFRCRVDFKKGPTRHSVVNLKIIVPPKKPTILGEKGLELMSIIGPYNEGVSLFLACEAVGGRPPPEVSWWRGSTLLDNSYEVTSVGIVRNDLLLQSLTREDNNSVFTCKAMNNNITKPASTSITLDMNLKPLDVKIINALTPLSANERYKFVCKSSGSRPPPIISWWNDNNRMKRTEETISPDINIITSILTFTPTSEDNGRILSCKAENPAIPGSKIEDSRQLVVHYAPVVQLESSTSHQFPIFPESGDVILECITHSNPPVHRVDWTFQDKPLHQNISSGIIISNQSLVLQKINRTNSGIYKCKAFNKAGAGESNAFNMKISHVPFCKNKQMTYLSASRDEEVKIVCEVNSYQAEVKFWWTFNDSSSFIETRKVFIESIFTKSTLVYIPRTVRDFGVFNCWASNEMGRMRKPCAFTILSVGVPDPPQNCSVFGETESSFAVICQEGYDGGLPQVFMCEIYDASTREIVHTVTNNTPVFHLTDLPSGSSFLMYVLSSNEKGRSDVVRVMAKTISVTPTPSNFDGWLIIIVVVVLVGIMILALLGIIIVVITQRGRRRNCNQEKTERLQIPLHNMVNSYTHSDEKMQEFSENTKSQDYSSKVRYWHPTWIHSKDSMCDNCLHDGENSGRRLVLDGINEYRYSNRKIIPCEFGEMKMEKLKAEMIH